MNSLRTCGWLVSLWIAASPALVDAADTADTSARSPPMTQQTADGQRRVLDGTYPRFATTIERWADLPDQPTDFRRKTAATDLRQYVLPRETRQKIERMRRDADRQYEGRDWPGAILGYNDTYMEVEALVRRFLEVHAYWFYTATRDKRQRLYREALGKYGFEDPTAAQGEALEQTLRTHIEAGDFQAARREGVEPLNRLFAQSVQALRDRVGVAVLDPDPLRRAPTAACVVVGPVNPAGNDSTPLAKPRLDLKRTGDAGRFYPRDAVLFGLIGNATVRVLIDATGCVAWAEVGVSSGHWRLDDAAMNFALLGARYQPGRLGDRAVPATMEYVVRFAIY